MQGINTPGFPGSCRLPLIYKQPQRPLCSSPQSRFSFSVLPVWGSVSHFHWALSFPVSASAFAGLFSGFSHFSAPELCLCRNQPPRLVPFPFRSLPVRLASLTTSVSISPLPALPSLSRALFPLLGSPVSTAMPFDRTSSPAPAPAEWGRQDGPTGPGRASVARPCPPPAQVPRLLQGLPVSQPESQANTKGRKPRGRSCV